jgi:hypothetical protein
MFNKTSNSNIFDNINELDAPPNNLDDNTKVEWYIRKAQSIKIKERSKPQKPKVDPNTGKRYTNIPIAKILDVDPSLVKECKVSLYMKCF